MDESKGASKHRTNIYETSISVKEMRKCIRTFGSKTREWESSRHISHRANNSALKRSPFCAWIYSKNRRTTLWQDLRRLRIAEAAFGRVNPSMVSNGWILQIERRPFRRLSLSRRTNLAWKCENSAISHCAFRDREMRFVPGVLCSQKGVRRIRHGLRGFVNGSFMTRESA